MAIPTLTVSAPRDLLALVPYRLGFVPTSSLVLVCLRGPRRRVGLVARVDLPAEPDEVLDLTVAQLVAHAVADGASAVVLVVYAVEGGVPGDVLDVLRGETTAADVAVLDAWHVTGDRYASLMCGDPRCCPPDGQPLSDLGGSLVSAEMVALGCVVGADREAVLGDLSPSDDARLRRVERAAASAARKAPVGGARRARWRSRLVTAWRHETAAVAGGSDGEVSAEAAGSLLAGLQDPTLRDAVMLAVVPGSGLAPEALAAHGPAHEVVSLLDRVFSPTGAVRPDESTTETAAQVLRSLVRQGTAPRTAAPLGLLAWLSWWMGDGASARCFVDRALAADPGHRLARLLGEALDRGVPPGWAQRDRELDLTGAPRE